MGKTTEQKFGVVLHPCQRDGGAGPAGAAGGAVNFTDHGGLVLSSAQLQLIFWGSAWTNAATTPSSANIINAVNSILSGPYLTGLSQYRITSKAVLHGTNVFSGSNPPNPFSDSDVSNMIDANITSGALPDPATNNQLLYMVIMPPGVGSSGAFSGEHTFYVRNGINVHFGWVTNGGTLDSVTPIFSHELVESITDPEGSAILGDAGSCNQGGWCEIGDVCYINFVLHGITVQKYWSQNDHSCYPTDAVKQSWDTIVKLHWKEYHKEFIPEKLFIKELKDYNIENLKLIFEGPIDPFQQYIEEMQRLSERIKELERVILSKSFIRPEDRPEVGKDIAKNKTE